MVFSGKPVFSVVHDPALRKTFVAKRGCGATCNGSRLAVSCKQNLEAAVLGTSIPPLAQVGREERDRVMALLKVASDSVFVNRPMAAVSLQLAYVAAGRLDGFWETGNDPSDWLAGSLLVTKAGGQATTLAGEEIATGDGILAGNRTIFLPSPAYISELRVSEQSMNSPRLSIGAKISCLLSQIGDKRAHRGAQLAMARIVEAQPG
ncbi:inositol monophosphatase family protein [Agrobacterium vitis]|uniref:inositol monophosphatase family protein n=1 Tax=Agrobacterium vitis TaxID=373 RepID=UPI001F3812DC|nr:inositol monophosphatase family protein [Agrobacterium vitis]